MPHPCAVKTCRNKAKTGTVVSFHRLPLRDPARLGLWLSALSIDVNTPRQQLRKYTVCSDHFVPEDYTAGGQQRAEATHRFLTPTAVPTVGVVSSCTPAQGAAQCILTGYFQQDSEDDMPEDVSFDSRSSEDTKPDSEELPPSLQVCVVKVEQIPVLEEPEVHPQVKEEQVDQCVSPHVEVDASNSAEVKHLKSELTTNCALTAERVDDKCNESDGLSHHSVEVFLELEQPPREDRSCHVCSKGFKRDSYLIRHVSKSHKGHKAFKCLQCNKEFDQRFQLVLHVRSHTGDKPFSCDYCGKTFVQNSSRLAHMRVHTGEKPYFCAKCGKSFATSNHFKFCKMQSEDKVTLEEKEADENHKEDKAFKCFVCNKEFDKKHQLIRHVRVHTGERPFSCDFCGKTFTQNSNRVVHMRQHTGEKPYFCDKCGKRFASSHHLKLCTGTQHKSSDKLFRCTTCGRTFHTDSNLKVHMEVHESWQRHISLKLQGQELDERKPKAI